MCIKSYGIAQFYPFQISLFIGHNRNTAAANGDNRKPAFNQIFDGFFFNNPNNPFNFLYSTMAILVICTITHFYTVAHLTALTALKQMDSEFEAVSQSLKQPFYRMFGRVTVPVCMPAILDISIYLFVNAMTTVSAVVFLYSPDTTLASVAVLNMDDAGDIAPAAAMGMMIFYTNAIARILHGIGGHYLFTHIFYIDLP